MSTLTPIEQKTLDLFVEHLNRVCPGEVEKVILYGSRARGDNRPDSDMDILRCKVATYKKRGSLFMARKITSGHDCRDFLCVKFPVNNFYAGSIRTLCGPVYDFPKTRQL